MAIIKSYTSLEQSKMLAEILPLESADMFLALNGLVPVMSKYIDNGLVTADETAIPCWSLVALLQILPIETYIEIDNVCCTLDINRDTLGKWFVSYYNRSYGSSLVTCSSKELLDAAFEMVCWLKENGKI